MREDFSGSKLDKQVADKVETPAAHESGERPEQVQQKQLAPPERREQRIAAIDAKRDTELVQLNAARTRLGLPPSDTSAAIAALDGERALLEKGRDTRDAGNREPARENQARDGTTERTQLVPGLEGKSGITPEIRYYFNEILGPEETAARMKEMGPKTISRIRDYLQSGNLHSLVSEFTAMDREVRAREKQIKHEWQESARTDPYGFKEIMDYPIVNDVERAKTFDAVERSIRRGRQSY